eukprot:g13867.t2
MAVADGAMAEAIRVSNLAGALLLQMEPPKTLEEVRLEVELASGIPSKLQSLVQGGEILDGGELTSGCELICVTDERPLYTWDWKGNPDAGHLQIEGSVLKAPSLQTDYVNVVTQEPLRSGVHYFEFVLHMVGDEQWCGVTRSRGAAGKHVSVRRREAEAWTYYCGRRRSREGTIRDGKGALHAHGKAIKDWGRCSAEFEKACSEGDVINMLVDMDKRIVAFAKDSRVQGAFKVPGTEPLYVLTQVDTIVDHYSLNGGTNFKGQWEKSAPHGMGRYRWPDGKTYCGKYRFDQKDGFGILTEANGTHLPHSLVWPTPSEPKPFVSIHPLAKVELSHWFVGCILYPVAVRLLQAAFLHATKARAQEKGIEPVRHFKAAAYFVHAVTYVEVLFLVWPMTIHILYCFFQPKDMLVVLMHSDWRLFRWALAVLCALMIVDLVQSPLRTLHHVAPRIGICLLSGIPWINHYDLPLFATAPLLYLSFQSLNAVAYFTLCRFHMQGRFVGSCCLKWMSVYVGIISSLGHLSMIFFYIEFVPYFQAWAPILVLIFFQLCLALENVYEVLRLRQLARPGGLSLASAPSSMHLPSLLNTADLVRKSCTPSRPPLRAPVLRHALPRPSVARRAKAGEALFPERSRRASESLAPQRPVALLDSQLRSAPSPQALRRALRQAQEKRWLNGALVATAAQRCGEARWWEQLVEVIEASRGLSLSPAQQRTVLLALASAGHGRGSEVLRLAVEVWTPPVDTLEAVVLPPEAWSSGTLPEQRLGLLELQQRYEEVDAMVRTLTPTAWLLRNLLSADATLRDWQRADELWAQMARAAPADGLAYAAYAKVHLLCGRPGAGLEILDQIMHGDTYLDAQYAIDYLQMLLVVCHSHTDAVNLQRLRGSFLVSLSNSRGLQRHWDRLEALGHQLLATPYRAATVKDLLVTRAAQESVMKDWDFAPNSGYLWDFAAPSGKREAENAQKTGDKKVETRREAP